MLMRRVFDGRNSVEVVVLISDQSSLSGGIARTERFSWSTGESPSMAECECSEHARRTLRSGPVRQMREKWRTTLRPATSATFSAL